MVIVLAGVSENVRMWRAMVAGTQDGAIKKMSNGRPSLASSIV